jgi:hypothetical protein
MKKAELVAQLEGAKALTSVVSIDNVIALIQQLEEGQAVKPEYSITAKLFTRIVDIIEDTIDGMQGRDVVDLGTAEFELDYNNCISLTDISIDTHNIYNEIREQLEVAIDIVDEEEAIEAQEQSASEE